MKPGLPREILRGALVYAVTRWQLCSNSQGQELADGFLHMALSGKIYLGDERFFARMQSRVKGVRETPEIPRAQRRGKARPLAEYLMSRGGRDEGVLRAYREGGYTQTAIARALDLSVSPISRVIRAGEAKNKTWPRNDPSACYDDWLGRRTDEADGFSIPTERISEDGRTLWCLYVRWPSLDSFNLIEGRLTLNLE